MIKKSKYNVAVIGVGAVGLEMLRVLGRRKFPVAELRVFARSSRDIEVDGQKYSVQAISPESFSEIDFALFAQYAIIAAQPPLHTPHSTKAPPIFLSSNILLNSNA